MVAKKHTDKIIIVITALAVILCLLATAMSSELNQVMGGSGINMEYESKLFDTDEIIDINIEMDEDSWNEMLSNALSEEYCVCNVIVNGTRLNNVAIRPKGNTSLSSIAMDPDTNRYSLKIEFDHFVDGQTCFGLDKLILNNNYADATNMKEALIYDMYQFIGADASLYNYAKVSVNGEYWGVYLALEAVDESFMLRNFGTQDGELYKPDSMEMGGGEKSSSGSSGFSKSGMGNFDFSNMDFSNFDPSEFEGMTPPTGGGGFPFGGGNDSDSEDSESSGRSSFGDFDTSNMPDMGDFDPSEMGGGGGGFSMGGNGSNLNYSDDELDSYSTIWEGEITSTSKGDHRRVVTALKNISEGNDIEKYLDVDNILKYMAVHTFAVNMDSLSGSMAHNYYLYEYDGQLNIFPWDYNLSFGGMSMGGSSDGSSVVNDAIDTPFSGTKFFDALLENEEYLEIYHSYLQQLVDEYVDGGRLEEVYNRIRSQIDSLVETDPTAFYTYDEYLVAAPMLLKTIQLRAESVAGQLDGSIPSTDNGQSQDSSSLIDASEIDIKAMGEMSMGGGGGFGGFGGDSDDKMSKPESSSDEGGDAAEAEEPTAEEKSSSDKKGGFDPSNMPSSGDRPDMGDFDPSNMPDMGGFTKPDSSDESSEGSDESTASDSSSDRPSRGGDRQMPSSFSGMPGQGVSSTQISNAITYGVCFAVMSVALIVVSCIKRK